MLSNFSMLDVHVTEHGELRVRKRMGLPRKAVEKMAQTALEIGSRHGHFSGSFRRYLDGVYLYQRTANNLRVYAGYVFLFDDADLITCWNVPGKFRKVKPRA